MLRGSKGSFRFILKLIFGQKTEGSILYLNEIHEKQ